MTPNYQTNSHWYQWLKWGDLLLYGIIAAIAFSLMLSAPGYAAGSPTEAVLVDKNKVVLTITADDLKGQGEKPLEANGYHYRLTWQDGRIRFSEADCPDQVCVRTGWISHPGQLAACVPGNLILKMNGKSNGNSNETSEVDVIVK